MTDIAGRTVVITGAASGLGRRLTRDAVGEGARVIAWDLDETGLKDLAHEFGAAVVTDVVDITDRAAVYQAGDRALALGPVDVLILNAGVVAGLRFLELPDEAVERVFAVNSLAWFWCTRAFLPDMVDRDRGHVVGIVSVAGITPLPGLTEYVASKHAAYGFLDTLRTELATDAPGVRTTIVLPQVLDTGMFEGVSTPILFPLVDPDEASRMIWKGVRGNRQRVLVKRFTLMTAYTLRLFRPKVSDFVARVTGAFEGMSTFRGRSILGERAHKPAVREKRSA